MQRTALRGDTQQRVALAHSVGADCDGSGDAALPPCWPRLGRHLDHWGHSITSLKEMCFRPTKSATKQDWRAGKIYRCAKYVQRGSQSLCIKCVLELHSSRAHRTCKVTSIVVVVATHRLQRGPQRRWSQRLAGEHPARHRLAIGRVTPLLQGAQYAVAARLDAKALHLKGTPHVSSSLVLGRLFEGFASAHAEFEGRDGSWLTALDSIVHKA